MSVAIRNRDTRLAKKESGGQAWCLFVQDYVSRFPVYSELAALPKECFTVSEPRAVATGPVLNFLERNLILRSMGV